MGSKQSESNAFLLLCKIVFKEVQLQLNFKKFQLTWTLARSIF